MGLIPVPDHMAAAWEASAYELLYGAPGATYDGLLTKATTRPLPEGTMTRQRRRAADRARSKAA